MILFLFPQIKLPFIILDGYHMVLSKAIQLWQYFFLLGNLNKTLKESTASSSWYRIVFETQSRWIRSRISWLGGCPGFVVFVYFWFALERKHTKFIALLLIGGKIYLTKNYGWPLPSFTLFLLLLICLI